MQNDNKTQAKKARVKGNPNFYVHLIIVFSLFFPALSLAATSLTLKAGWNLMGNGSSSSIDVATTFGDSEKISTVWKWNRGTSRWAFYAPSMNSDLLATYAQNKGYDLLSSIDSKEGFWVNAVTNAVAAAPAANGANLSVADIQVGWNLVSSADAQTPSQLNAFLASSLNAAGKAIITTWAWESASSKWRFYAPALESQGGTVLSDYVAGKGYLPFSTALHSSEGYWLNVGRVEVPDNIAPVAKADAVESIVAGALVTLDGSASSDANGDVLTYAWTLTSKPIGSTAVLSSSTTVKPTFTADAAGAYVATLVVTDGKLNSTAKTVTVTAAIRNVAPISKIGFAQNVVTGGVVTLDGSASSDANGDQLTYAWTLTSKPTGSLAALSSSVAIKPTFTADFEGSYLVSLVVSDGKLSSAVINANVVAIAPSLSLYEISDSWFSPGKTVVSMPYAMTASSSANVNCVGSGCATLYDVASFELKASGKSFTIDNLQVTNTTPGSKIVPVFSGLVSGQVVADGEVVSFKLQSPFTRNAAVTLNYSFTVLETGKSFNYMVNLKTN